MLSRHWRLWLSFPSLALPPEERLAFGLVASTEVVPPESRRGFLAAWLRSRRLTEPPRPCGTREPLRPLRGHLPFQGRLKWCGQCPPCAKRTFPRRAFPPLSTGPSLKTERFQRGRSCGTGGNPVRGAPARLHRHKQFVRGGSGGRHAAWKPCRPPAAFGSFPLRERNSHVRRRAKLPQAASSPSPVCLLFPHVTLIPTTQRK